MSNPCYNEFLISFENEEIGIKINKKLEDLFENKLRGEISYADEGIIEGWFESRWTFPSDIFENFFEEFEDSTIYMRCLSTEWGCCYVAMNVYDNGSWWGEQTFNF